MLKFILVLLAAAGIIGIASVAWGHFTTAPKPQALEAVEGAMTEAFGISDVTPAQPINISDAAKSVIGSVSSTIANRVETAVASQAIGAVAKKYDQLPEDQKKVLETIICKPALPAGGPPTQ